MMPAKIHLEGVRFVNLVVLKDTGERRKSDHAPIWKCRCNCGTIFRATTVELRRGDTKSCGCLRIASNIARSIHGQSNTRLHACWEQAIKRTSNKEAKDYHNYGGRGIRMYRSWRTDFVAFRDYVISLPDCPVDHVLGEMGDGTRIDLSLDRLDNDKGYVPGNLRWATRTTQNFNQRRNLKLTICLMELTIQEACEAFGKVSEGTVRHRLRWGWDPWKALRTPMQVNQFK